MLGVLGGGQLGRMFAQAAQAMGYHVAVLEADADSPASMLAQACVTTAYDDASGLSRLAALADAITTEFENVPAGALATLARQRPLAPPAAAVAICQDRAAEKAHITRAGVPCAPHAVIDGAKSLAAVPDNLFPAILKTARLGYDGKGQIRLQSRDELPAAWDALGRVTCVLEQRLPLEIEFSVILARGADGTVVNLPVQQNLHRDGILAVTEVPAPALSTERMAEAVECATKIAASMDYVGVLCVEFFGLKDGTLVANEMAPRPHNSGHYSIDACDVSQFELQVRCMTGLPLVAPRLHSPAVMLNLLGDLWFDDADAVRPPPWDAVLALPGAHLHLYGKAEPRRARKMGHLTCTGADPASALATARKACRLLGLPDL